MTAELRAAIVGCGRMGGTIDDDVRGYPAVVRPYSHAATYAVVAGVKVVAFADVDRSKLAALSDRWGIPPAGRYVDYREMIDRERPDIVSITTPPMTHAEVAIFAAEQGVRGIWYEKAMACSLAECDAMVAAIERHGVRFALGTMRR